MADTVILETTKTWQQMPTATQFIIQNLGDDLLHIAAASTQPADNFVGHPLGEYQSSSRLAPEDHWYRTPYGKSKAAFTSAD